MDLFPEQGFVFSVIEFVFSINKCHVPSSLVHKIQESGCRSNRFLTTIVRQAIEVIIQAQRAIFQRVCRETVESYYKDKLIEHFTEREFLEFLGFHARNCLLHYIDLDTASLGNPKEAFRIFNLVMNVIEDSKKMSWFTLNEEKLNAAAKEIVIEGLQRYTNQLKNLCKIMVSAASEKAKISQSSRTIYVVTETGKIESKMERFERVDDTENNDHEKKNEDSSTITKTVENELRDDRQKEEIGVSQEMNNFESANIAEVVEGSEKYPTMLTEETDRIRREIMEAMQEAPKRQRVEIESKTSDIIQKVIFIPDSDVFQEKIITSDAEILQESRQKEEIRESQKFNYSESANIAEVVEGSEKDPTMLIEETDRIKREIMEAMQEAPKRQRVELESKTSDIIREVMFIPDSNVLQEKIFTSDNEIPQEVLLNPDSKILEMPDKSQKDDIFINRRTAETNLYISESANTETLDYSIRKQDRTKTEIHEVKSAALGRSMKEEHGKSKTSDLKNLRQEENRKSDIFEIEEFALNRQRSEKNFENSETEIKSIDDSKKNQDLITREIIEAMQDAPKRSRN